ncbi:MAG TPA: hypothetical protein VGP72_23130 [Planctomycetota bacterium]|jgi:hypothetical protein
MKIFIALICVAASCLAGDDKQTPELVPLKLALPDSAWDTGCILSRPSPPLAPFRAHDETMLVPKRLQNLALNKTVTCGALLPASGKLEQVVDADKEFGDERVVVLGKGLQWVQIDLGEMCEVFAVVIWHDHKEPRVCHDVIVQVAEDKDMLVDAKTLFNNDADNSAGLGVGSDLEYIDSAEGKLIDAKGAKARFIRCYSNGNGTNDLNHYIEIEVWGRKIKK